MSTKLIVFTLTIIALCSNVSFAGDYYWINGSGNWNDGGHWSTNSGGSPSGIVPSANDNAIFDNHSLFSDLSLIQIAENAVIKNLTVTSNKFTSFHGTASLTVTGDLTVTSKAGFYLGGELIFKNESGVKNEIKTNGFDIYSDISFESGEWNLEGHLKTGKTNTIQFKSGTFHSNGFTVHAQNIYANQSPYNLDFTGSFISVLNKFAVSKAKNIGGNATYLVENDELDRDSFIHFRIDGDLSKDAIVFCTTPPFQLDLTITSDYNGKDISCFDSCDGEITVVASGTPGPFSFSLIGDGDLVMLTDTSAIFGGLCVGSHSVTVIDSSNEIAPGIFDECTISDDLNEPPIILLGLAVSTPPSCVGICDGSAITFPTGGCPPLNVDWEVSGESTPFPTMLCEGENPVIVSDINGCIASDTVTVNAPPIIIADPTITPPICAGDANAEININPSGGDGGPYTITWSPAPASGVNSNPGVGFSAGSINLTITDAGSCDFDTTILIIDPPVMSVLIDGVVNLECNGICIGEANADVTGGVPGYTFEWFDNATGLTTGITDQTATGLCAGVYFVVVTDAAGCTTTSATVDITEPSPFTINTDAYAVSCFGFCDGSVDVDVIGGTAPYNFDWTTFPGGVSIGTTDSISDLCPGQYQIIITDDNGCISTPEVVEVTEPLEIILDITGTDPTCYDLCDGTATATVTNGVAPFTYSWSPAPGAGDGTPTPTSMCADTYTLTLTDDDGCIQTNMITLDSPPSYDITVDSLNPLCFGDANGTIDITVNSGGSGIGYTYTWVPTPPIGDGTPNGSGLSEGTWTITVADSEGCDTTLSIDLIAPPEMLLTTNLVNGTTCNGDCDGEVNVSIVGGTGPYTAVWNDPLAQTGLVATGLCAGTYTVTVTDDNGCVETAMIVVPEPAAFDINTSQTDPTCFEDCDGTASVSIVSGGTGPYTILWDDPLAQTSFTATGLCAGTYMATVTDDNGCDTTLTFTLVEPDEIILDITGTDPTCYDLCDGTANATVTNGVAPFDFSWSPTPGTGDGTATPSDMCPGDYTLTLTDNDGCVQTGDITLVAPPSYDITVDSTDPLCFGDANGSIDITVNSGGSGVGYTYTWVPAPPVGDGTPNGSGLDEGTWTITIADSEGCDTTLSVELIAPPEIILTTSLVNGTTCNGGCDGEVDVTIVGGTGPFTVVWDDPLAQTGLVATDLCAGTYMVTVTDDNGCIETATIDVPEPAEYDVITSQSDPTCFGDCNGTATVNVISGGTAPYTILWDDPLAQTSFTAIDLCAGTYNATVTDDNGCDTVLTFTLTEPDEIVVTSNVIGPTCFGECTGSAFFTFTGGIGTLTFEWFDAATDLPLGVNNDSIFNLCAGDYYAIVTDVNNCTGQSADITIIELPEIILSVVSTTDATCTICNGTAEIDAVGGAGGFTYDWDPDPGSGDGTPIATDMCAGTYTVTVTDVESCQQTITLDILDIATEDVDLDSVDVSCFGFCDGEIMANFVEIDAPYTLEWFDNVTGDPVGTGNPIVGLCPGEYRLLLTNNSGCIKIDSITVNEPDEMMGTITATDVSCNGFCDGTASIVVTGGVEPYSYDWGVGLPGGGEGTPDATGLCAGAWEVEVTDDNGCIAVFTTTINEPLAVIIDSESSTDINCFGDSDGTATVVVSGGVDPYTFEWFDCATGLAIGQTTPTATGLTAGSYECVITDDNGCTITSTCLPVNEPSEITATFDIDLITCFGECDGLIAVSAMGGAGSFTYQWLDDLGVPIAGETNDTIQDICSGIFSVEVTDLNGCTQVFGPIDMNSPLLPWNVVPTQTGISCAGECDGTATVLVLEGNTMPYTYQWDDPMLQTTPTAILLCEGTYTVVISDAGTCDTTLTFTIIDENPIFTNVTAADTNLSCFGDCDGSITVDPIGGVGPYTLNWSDGQTGNTASALCAGLITLTITDASGCTKDTTFSVSEEPELTLTSSFTDNTACGLCNGTASVVVSGGVTPYTYDWTPDPGVGEGTANASELCPGVVSVLVTDDNGCELTEVFGIADVSGEDITITSTDVSCFGECDGTAEATFVCSEDPCTQEWFDALTGLSMGETTTTIADLCAGEYFIEVQNDAGCVSIENVIINSPDEIFANEVITPITCAGGSDGTITLFPTGGSGTVDTYAWSPVPPNGDGTNEALDLDPGIWEVTITDTDGCSETFSFDIPNPEPVLLAVTPTNVSCFSFCNGSILLSVTGGGGGYAFQWFMDGVEMIGETSSLVMGLCPGNYNVQVTDANGCLVTLPEDIVITEPTEVIATVSSTDISCFGECDGTATVEISGGVEPYIINWYDAATGSLIGISDPIATDLCEGDYYAIVTDDNGCALTTDTVNVNEPEELTFTFAVTNAGCFGFCDGTGEIILSGGTPPYSYTWLTDDGDPIIGGTGPSVSDLCAGNYTVVAVDSNGCSTGTIAFAIGQFPEILGSVFVNDATCGFEDGNSTVFASGGAAPFSYQWFDETMDPIIGETDMTILDVSSGIYFVTVTDINGCSETFMATISDTDGPEVTFDAINNPTCFGECDGSVEITISGDSPPFTYVWNPDGIIAEDPTGLCAGEYLLEVTDDLECHSYETVTLVDPAEINATAVIAGTTCGECNGSIDLTLSGGTGDMTVLWNTGSTELSLTDLCGGVYEAEITDENGCSIMESFVVGNSEGLTGNLVKTDISCAGSCDGAVIVTGVGGIPPYTYEWLHDGSTSDVQTGLCAGTYYVEITDSTNCLTTLEVEFIDPLAIEASSMIINPNCGLSDGTLTITSSGGILPHTYLWNTGAMTSSIHGIDAGVYMVTITDATGCSSTFTYEVSNLSAAVVELTATDIDCFGNCNGTIDTLGINGGTPAFTFEWFNSDATSTGVTTPLIENLCEGTYFLQVTDAVGCVTVESTSIEEPDTILFNPLFGVDASCFESCDGIIVSVPFGGTLPFSYSWNDPANQTNNIATGLCEGTYVITVTDANGCMVSDSSSIGQPTPIEVIVDSTQAAICQDSNEGAIFITASGGTPGYSYEWISETLLDTINVEDPSMLLPMQWYLTVTDANGCMYMDTVALDTLIKVTANAGPDTVICNNFDFTLIGTSNILTDANYTWFDTLGNVLSDTNTLTMPGMDEGVEYYVLEVLFSGCSDYDTVQVTTNGLVFVEAGPDIDMFNTQTEVIGGSPTTDPTSTVLWSPAIFLNDPTSTNPSVIEPLASTWYYAIATDTNGCNGIDSVFVEVLQELDIPDGISPGSDGKNDTWILDIIDQYEGVAITINVYNRWGDLLFESDENYNDDWGGTTEDGKRLPAGTYYYVIKIEHEDYPDPLTGPLTIMW